MFVIPLQGFSCLVLFVVLLFFVFSGCCPALWSPCWGRGSKSISVSLNLGLFTVCLGLLCLPLGSIGRLCSVIVVLP